jgi:hypothetical protein
VREGQTDVAVDGVKETQAKYLLTYIQAQKTARTISPGS